MDFLIYNPESFDKRVDNLKKWRKDNEFDYCIAVKKLNDEKLLNYMDSLMRSIDSLIDAWTAYKKTENVIDRRLAVFWAIQIQQYVSATFCLIGRYRLDGSMYEDDDLKNFDLWWNTIYTFIDIYLPRDEYDELNEITDVLMEMEDKDPEDYTSDEKDLLNSLKGTRWYDEYSDGWTSDFILDLFEEEDGGVRLVDWFAKA